MKSFSVTDMESYQSYRNYNFNGISFINKSQKEEKIALANLIPPL